MSEQSKTISASGPAKAEPGICIPWEEKLKELPQISGDEELFKRIWEDNESATMGRLS